MKKIFFLIVLSACIISCKEKGSNTPGVTGEIKHDTIQQIAVSDKGNLSFGKYFTDKTMRLDYYHAGTSKEEHFSVDKILSDGSWSGSKISLLDRLNLGLYFFEVADKESGLLLYSKGFASVFGEWQTTPEAESGWGTFHESLRFPWPQKPVNVIMKKRDASNNFVVIWSTSVDPASRQVNPADIVHTEKVLTILENGPAENKVDIVILGDGYSMTEMDKFKKDASRLAGYLMNASPFRERKNDFNIRAVETPAGESGVSKPHHGIYRRTPLSAHYSSFDSERYVLSYDNRTIRDVASAVPYDLMVILVNERTYGGGGIYNLYTTVSADNKFAEYIMIHEMGHHMAALADEYYTSSVAYEVPEVKVEPWETNITALFDKNNLKWKDLVEEGTPVPTPWNKEEFDRAGYAIQKERDSLRKAMVPENVMEDLFTRQALQEDKYFEKEKYREKVGAFEGAGYLAKGLYRPQVDCIMYSRHLSFCKVCRRSIETVIDSYTK
ncbi:MAG: IgA Peptidase M64 [Bacteroidales bacterium]